MDAYNLVCFGETIYDIQQTKKKIAGAPLNTASFCAFLGLKTALISAIGNEKSDEKIKSELKNRNIGSFLQKNNHETGKAKIILDKNKVPKFEISKNSAYDHIKITRELIELVENTQFLYFGSLSQRNKESRETLFELLSLSDSIKVYDVNLRKGISSIKNIVKNSLKISTILKMNEAESIFVKKITGCSSIEKIFDKTNLEVIFVTLGQNGAKMYTVEGEKYSAQVPKVNVIDTTGCGDAFTAAVIYGLNKNWFNLKILKYSVKFSSEVAKYEGAFNKTQLEKSIIKNQVFQGH